LAGRSGDDGRSISRALAILDHGKDGGPRGFFTVIGGKATVLRAMGEAAADRVEAYLGPARPAGAPAPSTADIPLPAYKTYWKEGGRE